MADEQFSKHAKPVAIVLLGNPEKSLSSKTELRWGGNGSMSLDLKKSTWYDHENNIGGGVLDLIKREKGLEGREAVEWMNREGFTIEGRQQPSSGGGQQQQSDPKPKMVKSYDYKDRDGTLIYQVCRYEVSAPEGMKKTFRQRKPDGNGWSPKVKDLTPVPYNLENVLEAIAAGEPVAVVEGEKDVDNLGGVGIVATCNSGGAGKFQDAIVEYFKGAHILQFLDNDVAGKNHGLVVGSKLKEVVASHAVINIEDAWSSAPEKGDVSDWIEANPEITREVILRAAEETGRRWRPTRPDTSFGAILWDDLDLPVGELEWLMKNILTRKEMSLVYGASMSGKSFLALDLALAVARGEDYLGKYKTRQGGVVYQAGEGGAGLKQRARAYRSHHMGGSNEVLPFALLPRKVDLFSKDGDVKALIIEIKNWEAYWGIKVELFVIDTFSTATPGANENASNDVSTILSNCDLIREECGCHVMIVHHMNANGEKPRGHTSMFANAENALHIIQTEMKDDRNRIIRQVKIAKQKDGESGKSWQYVLRGIQIGVDDENEPVISCVVDMPTGQSDEPEKGWNLTKQQKIAFSALMTALVDHGKSANMLPGVPSSAKTAVEYKKWKECYSEISMHDDDDDKKRANAINKAMQRSGEALLEYGIIGRSNKHIWWTGKKVKGVHHNIPEARQGTLDVADQTEDHGEEQPF